MSPLNSTRRLFPALAGLVLGGAACSFIVDFQECRTHADCAGADQPLACSADHRCVTAAELPPCASHQECADAFGDDYVCGVSSQCISALTDECTSITWPKGVDHDQVVFVGSMIPVSPPYDAITVPLENAIELAVADFNATASLPGDRKIAWIACDDRGVADLAVNVATHLTEEIGVPAIIGPVFSEEVLRVATEVTVPAGTFLITPTASNKAITTLDDKDLVWRPIPSDVYQSSAIRDRILVDLDPKPANLVILTKDDAYGNGILEDISAPLAAAISVTALRYPDPTSFASEDELLSAYSLVLAAAIEANPDTVLIVGTSEAAQLVGAYVSTLPPGTPPPRFLFSHGAVPVMEDTVLQFPNASRPALMTLMEGFSPIIQDADNFAAYNNRYKIRFHDEDALTTSSLSYDSALVTFFAMATVGDGKITGSKIAAGMARLVDKAGTPISFGGTDLSFIRNAVDAIAVGNVDLRGVSGELDFDLTTGEVRTNIVGWDLTPKPGTTDIPLITLSRLYLLNPPPATDGMWVPVMAP
ncbi:MAG: ABC transporter substrate-binding protein [Myxococcales bacterium]|nr:ABC transporter substrate-binding protein [Myxococcales bacterium]